MIFCSKTLKFIVVAILLGSCIPEEKKEKMNVLFIAMDDMNDWNKLFDEKNPIEVPNLKRLAKEGFFFSQAYCNSPACNPSRASILSGVRPSTSGVYGNASDWKSVLKDVDILPEHFQKNGYKTYCAGKIFHHHGPAFLDYSVFSEYLEFPSTMPPDSPMPEKKLNYLETWYDNAGRSGNNVSPNFDWGQWPQDGSKHIDEKTVDWALEKMQGEEDPFFMAVGIFRPHMPFFVPDSMWLAKYPMDKLILPTTNENDFDDLPQEAIDFIKRPNYRWMETFAHRELHDSLFYESAIRAYQASATFSDYQVGRLLDGLQAAGKMENTIIVLWSDHGYHLGEKEHWEKFVLYEKATHIPMIISVPGFRKNVEINSPVSLIDLYPTLSELCDLDKPKHLEGSSLMPLLESKEEYVGKPVLITYEYNNHAVRSQDYRYIRLANGSEELYYLPNDPNEWTNLATQSNYRQLMDSLGQWIPKVNASPIPNVNKNRK